jgi:hypothetical protein
MTTSFQLIDHDDDRLSLQSGALQVQYQNHDAALRRFSPVLRFEQTLTVAPLPSKNQGEVLKSLTPFMA